MSTTEENIDTAATAAAIKQEMAEATKALSEDLRTDVYWSKLAIIASSNSTHDEKMIEVAKLNKAFSIA